MKYFKGSRRRVRKSSSHIVSGRSDERDRESTLESTIGSISTSDHVVDSPETERMERKRPRVSDKKEEDASTVGGSKKRKSQSSGHKHVQLRKSKSTEKPPDQEQSISSITTAQTRNRHVSEQSSASESEGGLNSSEKRHSVVLCDGDKCQSDRSFLQQQINLLKAPFQLEVDCPVLAKIKANDSKHIPLEVIHNTLTKVNHKTEDEVLQSLHRQAQGKVLRDLQGTMHKSHQTMGTGVTDDPLLERYKELQIRVAELEKTHDEIKQQHTQHKHIGVLVSQLETVSEEFSSKTLIEEVDRTNSSGPCSGSPVPSDYTPSTHQQLVQILFKD